ncbi:esterase FrsA [Streptomyces melanosporofaciens]|uniref:Esterase FrsA n=2 Tax=Streptomyces melanosporofaciens TaxID=67327 RepID=A0A1H4Z8P1_STRMJ|nr:esterase FrsA [Streptomyces melanosporofaciens]
MTYPFPVDPENLFEERTAQFVNLGLPSDEVARLRAAITNMWADAPGGWTWEWSRLAERYAAAGEHYLASLAYGGARFPCLADPAKAAAMDRQVEQYTLAAQGFPVGFERRTVTVRYREAIVEVRVHVLSPADAGADTPVLIASGGIDTWKMDLHPMWEALALGAKVRIVAFEHAGVGELTHIPMAADTQAIIGGLLHFARTLTTGKVGHFGLSFGGYFSAQTGLRGDADAAVVLGGPVTSATFGPEHAKNLLYGMADIFGNAVGFTTRPDMGALITAFESFALDELLTTQDNCPMLVINGDADVHVPIADTTVFNGRQNTQVELIPGGSHCALNKLDQIMPIMINWIANALHP